MVENLQTKIKVHGRIEERIVPIKNGKISSYWEMKFEWYDENGKRHRRSKTTGLPTKGNKTRAVEMLEERKKALQEKVNTQATLKQQQQSVQPSDERYASYVTFAEFILKDWLEAVRRGDKKACKKKVVKSTFGGYQENVETYLYPYFKETGVLLSNITAKDINDFYTAQYKRTVKNTGKKLSEQTVLKYHNNIFSAINYASKMGYIESADKILKSVDRPNPDEFEAKPYGIEEAMALIEAVRGHILELAVILGVYYGLRRSEIIGLRWESICFHSNEITIEHCVVPAKIDGVQILDEKKPKSKTSQRTLPLVPILRAKLLEVQAEYLRNRTLCGNSYNKKEGDVYILVDSLGNRMKSSYITSAFPEFLKKNKLRRIRFHDLRHTSARLLLKAGVPLEKIIPWLGHSSYQMARRYAKYDKSENVESAEKLTWLENTSLADYNVNFDGDEDVKIYRRA